jgi:hypothetical protein
VRRALLAYGVALVFAPSAGAQLPDWSSLVEPNGAAGGNAPALVLNGWDIRGPRNVQCGSPVDPNCDMGAGSSADPGWLTLQYDVGLGVKLYAGQGPARPQPLLRVDRRGVWIYSPSGRLMVRIGERVTFYRRPRVHGFSRR